MLGKVMELAKDAFFGVVGWMGSKVSSGIDEFNSQSAQARDLVVSTVGGALGSLGSFLGDNLNAIFTQIKSVFQWVTNKILAPFRFMSDTINEYADKWKDVPLVGSALGGLQKTLGLVSKASSNVAEATLTEGQRRVQQIRAYRDELMEKAATKVGAWKDYAVTKGSDFASQAMGYASQQANVALDYGSNQAGNFLEFGKKKAASAYEAGKGVATTMASDIKKDFGELTERAKAYDYEGTFNEWKGKATDLIKTMGNVDMQGVHPGLRQSFLNAVKEYRELGGDKDILITSGYRSLAKQAELFKKMPDKAAPPGRSLHNFGFAIDADRFSGALGEMDRMGLLSKFGLERPIPDEPWHVQPKGITLKAAKAGIYSADNPQDQGAKSAGPTFQESMQARKTPSVSMVTTPVPGATSSSTVAPVSRAPSIMAPGAPIPPITKTNVTESVPAPVAQVAPPSPTSSQSAGPTRSASVDDIPMFAYSDAGFFAANLGALT